MRGGQADSRRRKCRRAARDAHPLVIVGGGGDPQAGPLLLPSLQRLAIVAHVGRIEQLRGAEERVVDPPAVVAGTDRCEAACGVGQQGRLHLLLRQGAGRGGHRLVAAYAACPRLDAEVGTEAAVQAGLDELVAEADRRGADAPPSAQVRTDRLLLVLVGSRCDAVGLAQALNDQAQLLHAEARHHPTPEPAQPTEQDREAQGEAGTGEEEQLLSCRLCVVLCVC